MTIDVRHEHRQGNEPREPEDHRHGFHGKDREVVVRSRLAESPRHRDEEDQGEQRPDRGEEEEVVLAGGRGVPPVMPPVGDCRAFTSVQVIG